MATNDPRFRPRGRCLDCGNTYPLAEAVLHDCPKAIERQVRTRTGWWPVIVAVVIVAAIAWIVGRMMI